MKYLDMEEGRLRELGAIDTAREISGQPALWNTVFDKLTGEEEAVCAFIDMVFEKVEKIILTGAGSSAYIGYSLEGIFHRRSKKTTLSIPSTHLVSHAEDYLEATVPTLLVSFARSGNSPESVAVIKKADSICRECYHLIITCNPEGDLANQAFRNSGYVYLLPPESNDKSLAMTGSYSGMLLAALLISDIRDLQSRRKTVKVLQTYGQKLLTDHRDSIRRIAALPFNRAVFLGSGPQFGTATESHLKLQELTDGKVICKHDSYLGFRHGPKAVVDEQTLMVYYMSNIPDVLRYELDLVTGMSEGKKPLFQVGISERHIAPIAIDELLAMADDPEPIGEAYITVAAILFGQMLGFYKSIELQLQPDSPSASGAISRIVKGVTIY
jgi:tagatose-6-phosphate ketose/aldose isomerase